jgi:hypothetical protein
MAKPRYYEIKVIGVETVLGYTPVGALRVRYRPDAGSTADLRPIHPGEYINTDPWDAFHYIRDKQTGSRVKQWLFRFCVARLETRGREVGNWTQSVTVFDPLADFSKVAPLERVTHKDTTLLDELTYVCEAIGLGLPLFAVPEIVIPRIDYLPSASYWSSIAPWLGPFEPFVVINPNLTGGKPPVEILPTIFLTNDHGGATLEVENIASADLSFDVREVVNQTKLIIHRRRGEKSTGTASGVMERRVPRTANGDGTSSENWERYVEVDETGGLEDEEAGVSAEKEEVIVGHGYMHWSSQGLPIRKDVSETEYEENYSLPVRQTRTISGRVNLPIVGEVYREEAFEEVTDTTWIPWEADNDHPYTWTMTKQRTERRGFYLVNEKVPIDVATANNSVDTTTDSSQTYAKGLHTVIETVYQAIAGDSMVMQKTTTYNTLYTPARVVGDPEVSFVGRNTVTLQARPKTWRITGNVQDFTPRPEVTFDGTLFGYALSVRMIEAIHRRAGQDVTTGVITPLTPDLMAYRVGMGLTVNNAASIDIPAKYLITEVEWIAEGIPSDGTQEVRIGQRIHVRSLPAGT